jgi:branched-chain amino acid aminotransferase
MSARVSPFLSINGQIQEAASWNPGMDNRALMYGDAIFESIRVHQGMPLFIEDHFERLLSGMYMLGLDNTLFDALGTYENILALIQQNSCQEARLRILVYRNSGGFYRPETDACTMVISMFPIEGGLYPVNERGLRLGLYTEIRKPVNGLAGIKSASALHYVLAAREARNQGWDEALLVNEFGRICEATASNIFLYMGDNRIMTPALTEGILPGVYRKQFIPLLMEEGYRVDEGQILPEHLYKAEEVWLCNAIQGLRWAISYRERRYFSTRCRILAERFQQTVDLEIS